MVEKSQPSASARFGEAAQHSSSGFTFIDLFAGIGGMRLGLEAVGGHCVFSSEIDDPAVRTYLANFDVSGGPGATGRLRRWPDAEDGVAGDITAIDAEQVPRHDVLAAGFPCQPFSLAGVSKKNSLGRPHGFACTTQGTLFFHIERLLRHHRPKAFLLENVGHLLYHDGRRTFEVIRHTLEDDLEYAVVQWRVLDSAGLVPQRRRRLFIVGFRDPCDFDFRSLHLPDPSAGPLLGSILHREDKSELPEEPYTLPPDGRVNPKYTLSPSLWRYLQEYSAKHRASGHGFGYSLVGRNDVARTLSARYYKDGSEILVRTDSPTPRRLTPRECSRIMGFDKPPDAPHRGIFKIPVSDTQAYRQFGNAVVPAVVARVAAHMKPHLLGTTANKTGPMLQLRLPAKRT